MCYCLRTGWPHAEASDQYKITVSMHLKNPLFLLTGALLAAAPVVFGDGAQIDARGARVPAAQVAHELGEVIFAVVDHVQRARRELQEQIRRRAADRAAAADQEHAAAREAFAQPLPVRIHVVGKQRTVAPGQCGATDGNLILDDGAPSFYRPRITGLLQRIDQRAFS